MSNEAENAKAEAAFAEIKTRVTSMMYAERHGIKLSPGMLVTGIELNDRARKISNERSISFAEALPIAAAEMTPARPASMTPVDERSLVLNALAERIAKRDQVEFGEALQKAAEFEPGLTPAQIGELFGPSVKDPTTPTAKEEIARLMQAWGCSQEMGEKLYLLSR